MTSEELPFSKAPFLCCGVPLLPLTMDEAVRHLATLPRQQNGHAVHLCNAYTLALAARNSSYSAVLRHGAHNLPDGAPVAFVGRRQGRDLNGPVRGPSLMIDVMRDSLEWSARHVLYGATPEVLHQLDARLRREMPNLLLVDAVSPPFRPLNADERAATILRLRAASADYVWVGLGTPKQDMFAYEMSQEAPSVFIAVGAAFDFIAGTKREAPSWLQGSGLEWVFRLLSEPRRLWKRYLVGNLVFLLQIVLRGEVRR